MPRLYEGDLKLSFARWLTFHLFLVLQTNLTLSYEDPI